MSSSARGLVERLQNGETVICVEGYLWELERRGYAKLGDFTPEVVLDEPDRVRSLHEEFVHAGSDVVEAFTYYGHRSKMRSIGREDDLETLNLAALKIAREVADRTGTLMAGGLSNSTVHDPERPESIEEVRDIFKEQVEWAVKGNADYIVAETFDSCSEANLALETVLKHGNGLPAVITLAAYVPDRTLDDVPFPQALKKLEEAGATVVGLNCDRGPATMLPLLREIRKTCKCGRSEIRQFAKEALEMGVQYVGLCCGNASHYVRELAVASGRYPPAMKYKPEPHKSVAIGDKPSNARTRKLRNFLLGDIE